ncbi:7527_t:CDS:1, partial [Funneliformis mosseae]
TRTTKACSLHKLVLCWLKLKNAYGMPVFANAYGPQSIDILER